MTEEQSMEVVDVKTGELVKQEAPSPEDLLLSAKEAASALERVIMSNDRPPVMFNGRRHLEYPHWQTIGKFYHASVRTLDAEPVEIGGVRGFKAKAQVLDENTGIVIGGAEAYCMADERNWSGKPLFQLASMAQTRAGSKALSNKFRYVAIVAGYEPTPSEEMPDEMRGQRQVAMPKAKTPTPEPVAAEIEMGAPKEPLPESKFFTQLHKLAREKNVPPEKLKWIIKETYRKDSSKDLLDSECVALIKLIQAGAVA
jgi:hypothetical protein